MSKEKTDFFKVYGQNSETQKRDKLIELMTMGAKNRSSVTGALNWNELLLL